METVNPLKQERDELKAKAAGFDGIQKDLDAANAKIKELEANSGDVWKTKYEAAVEEKKSLQQSFDSYKAEISEKELSTKKKAAYRDLLKAAGVSEKRLDTVLKASDFESVELDDNGKIKDSDELTKTIKSEWADFIGTTQQHGASVSNPPANNGGTAGVNTRAAEIAKARYARIYGISEDK